ncbi:predicted protein [Culex quinquefasciatus]|uniref:Predicted protein n=1 Tax=Culex quinquefasciatus TaxID=7176 RepID=B0XD22_CULQU|nr:predicted protein [Culex quinquefasciatus]|eukprot:XP_001867544.1 predicted protein [Culex quinquefasciatus]
MLASIRESGRPSPSVGHTEPEPEDAALCPDCGKRFAKSHHLKAHLNTHYRGGSSSSPNTSTTNNNHLKSSCSSDPADPPAADPVTPMDEDDAMMSASSDFRLVDDDDDEEEGSSDGGGGVVNPFGQLVNIGDYMIAKAAAAALKMRGEEVEAGRMLGTTRC